MLLFKTSKTICKLSSFILCTGNISGLRNKKMIYNSDVPGRILPWFTMDIKRRYKCDVNEAISDRGEILTSLLRYEHLFKKRRDLVIAS